MSSVFPGVLDSLPINHTANSPMSDHAQVHNDLADAINKIEAELGITPRTNSPNKWNFVRSPGQAMFIGGQLDGNFNPTGTDLVKLWIEPSYINGTNGARGDSITSDAANSGGHTSFAALQTVTAGFIEKGSNQLHSTVATNSQPVSGNAYNELIGHFLAITANRKGALTEAIEAGVISNVAARVNTISAFVAQNVTLAQYATDLGAGSTWARTGARGMWVLSNGSQAAGTGIFIQGSFNAGIRFEQPAAQTIMQAQRSGEANPRFAMLEDGTHYIGPGSSGFDTIIRRDDAAVVGSNGGFQLMEYEPPAGPADSCRLFLKDNGSGKTQLWAKFATGASQLLATQP
jgi:hypothetical protein